MAKKAVLIGINYPGTDVELKGCINDVQRMHDCLVQRYGFPHQNIFVLIDAHDSSTQPTGKNINDALEDLVDSAHPGDILFVHYSGHGTRLPPESEDEDDTGYDECIVPTDMNLITDDDFRELVDRVPAGCQLTIVSDSCHSGGLIDETKEQIGESTIQNRDEDDYDGDDEDDDDDDYEDTDEGNKDNDNNNIGSRSLFRLRKLLRKTAREVDGFPHRDNKEVGHKQRDQGWMRSKSLPLPSLIKLLKQRTGKDDIDVGKVRRTLFSIFGDDASPKVKKFMKTIFSKLKGSNAGDPNKTGVGFFSQTLQYLEDKLIDKDKQECTKPTGFGTSNGSKQGVDAGGVIVNKGLLDSGILISGCQTHETSADATPTNDKSKSYGALSNAIQTIIQMSDGNITNKEVVMVARELLQTQGFTQRPGLYCSDDFVDARFVCK